MADLQTVSILLLGDDGVGKSTFLSRLSLLRRESGLASDKSAPPLLRDGDQPFVLDLRTCLVTLRLEFSDTASPENWRCLRPDMIIMCFDISSRPSLASLASLWIKEIRTVFAHSDSLPILVLGLKRDLRREDDPAGVVYPQEAYAIAQQMRADMYLECSAATGTLMAEVLEDVCRRAAGTTTPEGGQSEGTCRVM
ncbi:Rho-like protein [Grosmannia clavigera kw1407]|uniref:Rho-like protein n=1 Tax=Grosmannia clavigera (strain kw1407 / UAMH 11150) TaxID=655863 RepID=F0XDE2_GROCL|nr:Rho-like protein [Grosmannia clavigera kw1407]EFX04233.1 Rho-like protein [Grosmannia clavigera kw1407]